MNKVSRTVLIAILAISTLFLMAFTPALWPRASSVAAATPQPPSGERAGKNLSFLLQREQNALLRQQLRLTRATQAATKAQELIDKARAKGLNVDDLVKALADFNTQLASAQESHDQAASILNAHAGFDNDGNVTDRQAAHQTLVDARNNLRQAHLTLTNAVLHLRIAVQQWKIKNQNTK